MLLTNEQVAEIRALYATNSVTQCDLAARFGVNQQYISRIIRDEARASRGCAFCGSSLPRGKHHCCGGESCIRAMRAQTKRAYLDRHPGIESARARRWQQAHPEQWAEAHRKASREYERRQRAKEKASRA